MTNRAWGLLAVLVVVLLFAMCGCGNQPPPAHFSIASDFSEAEAEVIRDTVGAWCDAVGWCPEEVLWADRGRFELVDDLSGDDMADCPPGKHCGIAARNHNEDIVWVARNRPNAQDMGSFWIVIAHELGHYCGDGHTKRGLMKALHVGDERLEIDADAVDYWHDGCP